MANIVDRLTERVMQRAAAAFELPDEAHRCPACDGDGYVLADDRVHETMCAACDGSGLRAEEGGGDGA